MATEPIDLTLSSDDDEDRAGTAAAVVQQPQPQPQPSPPQQPQRQRSMSQLQMPRVITPQKCKSEPSDPTATNAVVMTGVESQSTRDDDGDDEGLKPATTGGKGLWSLWTRNFNSPLLMLLDLVDNAVDAAMQAHEDDGFMGRVHVYRDLYESLPGHTYPTGICIRNNSPKDIPPLKEVLRLFISAKADSGFDSIGENGVGLKQSCAALSDLSFVLVKNGANNFELGIIAKALQREEMVVLPCFEFEEGSGTKNIGQQMLELFTKPQYKAVADCVAEYGRVRPNGGSPSVARGVARLAKHFDDINHNFFDNPFVFEVIVDKVMHHGNSEASGDHSKNAVREIMNELQREVPRRYLHIPDESFQFSVGKKEISFKYWTERLVEFTKIEIPCRSEIPFDQDFGHETPDSYFLSVYLGFDRFNIARPEEGVAPSKKCSLYTYSRVSVHKAYQLRSTPLLFNSGHPALKASGRLIQYEPDARTLLGLTAGGTDFCQSLTVIIDDKDGHLPLDPTKQGIAFGNQAHGEVHRKNLYAVVGCVVKFYYRHHLKKYGGRKTILTEKITAFVDSELPEVVKSCSKSELTDYGVTFHIVKGNRIQVDHTFYTAELIGPDTIFRLLPQDKIKTRPARPNTKKKRCSPAKRNILVTKARKLSADRARPAAKAREAHGKRKRRAARANKLVAKKSKCAERPERRKGTRTSPRLSIGTPPKKYLDAYSDPESEHSESDSEHSVPESDVSDNESDYTESDNSGSECAENDRNSGNYTDELRRTESEMSDDGFMDDIADQTTISPDSQSDVGETNDEVVDNSQDIKSLNAEVSKLRKQNKDLKGMVTTLKADKESLEREVANLREELKHSKRTVSSKGRVNESNNTSIN